MLSDRLKETTSELPLPASAEGVLSASESINIEKETVEPAVLPLASGASANVDSVIGDWVLRVLGLRKWRVEVYDLDAVNHFLIKAGSQCLNRCR